MGVDHNFEYGWFVKLRLNEVNVTHSVFQCANDHKYGDPEMRFCPRCGSALHPTPVVETRYLTVYELMPDGSKHEGRFWAVPMYDGDDKMLLEPIKFFRQSCENEFCPITIDDLTNERARFVDYYSATLGHLENHSGVESMEIIYGVVHYLG